MTRPINLLHLVFDLGIGSSTGGMENGVINLCNRLPKDEFNSSICTVLSGGEMVRRLNTSRVDLVQVKSYIRNDITYPFRLARLLRRRRIDIVHTHNWGTLKGGLAAAKLSRVPIVHGEHGKMQSTPRQIFAQRTAWRHADCVLAVSSDLADRMTREVGFPRHQIQVISNGVDTTRFQTIDTPKIELRRQLGLPTAGQLIGMVARFVAFKDHVGVFRALAKLRQGQIDVHLVLAGDGPMRGELDQLAKDLDIEDYVHFLGVVDRVERVLHAVDVIVSNSSHNEGMSNTLLEAMAAGVPVVATRVAASPELLDEGNAGLLIAPRDTTALVDALRRLIIDPELRKSLSRIGHHRVEQHYNIAVMVDSYRRMYMRLVNKSSLRNSRHPMPTPGVRNK